MKIQMAWRAQKAKKAHMLRQIKHFRMFQTSRFIGPKVNVSGWRSIPLVRSAFVLSKQPDCSDGQTIQTGSAGSDAQD